MIADIKKRALHRTRILEGQIQGLEKMIDNEDYCVDIVTQPLAIEKSLGSLNKLFVENHLRTHVAHMFEAGGDHCELAITELLRVFELSNNRGDRHEPRNSRATGARHRGRTSRPRAPRFDELSERGA